MRRKTIGTAAWLPLPLLLAAWSPGPRSQAAAPDAVDAPAEVEPAAPTAVPGPLAAEEPAPAAAEAAPSPPSAEPATAEALGRAHARRFAAMVERDLEALGALLADELTYTHSNGRVETKEQFLAALASGALEYLAIVSEGESAVRLYADGEVGLIAGAARVTVRTGGREGAVTLRYTSVYVHRDGRWQLVAWHSSAVPAT
jgi:ketosteroid isomerase-like protein